MNTNFAFIGSDTEIPFWYQEFEIRQIGILKGSQPIVDFVAADSWPFYVTTMKAMSFQDDIHSIPIADFRDHYVPVFGLISMQDATGNSLYPKLVREF